MDDNGNLGWTSKDRQTCGVVASFPFGRGSVIAHGGDYFYYEDPFRNVWRHPLD